jgi:hypothetical protein
MNLKLLLCLIPGGLDAVKRIYYEKGIRGLYKGYFAALATYGNSFDF